jgi:hypothetical protein
MLGTETTGKTDLATRKTTYAANYTKPKKTADIAKLPGSVLAHENAASHLTVDVLKAIASTDKEFSRVSTEQREIIEDNVERAYHADITNKQLRRAWSYLKTSKGQEDFLGRDKS